MEDGRLREDFHAKQVCIGLQALGNSRSPGKVVGNELVSGPNTVGEGLLLSLEPNVAFTGVKRVARRAAARRTESDYALLLFQIE